MAILFTTPLRCELTESKGRAAGAIIEISFLIFFSLYCEMSYPTSNREKKKASQLKASHLIRAWAKAKTAITIRQRWGPLGVRPKELAIGRAGAIR
jgi:hypothetical protein